MHLNSELLFTKYAKEYFKPGMRVLEVGPNTLPSKYRTLVGDKTIQWETIGLTTTRHKGLTYRTNDGYTYPTPDNYFDIVLSGQVLEHVPKIWVWMRELSRIARGYVITINPVSWEYHEAPVDCWRVYPDGMKALYDDAGLKVILSVFEGEDVVDTITIGKK